MSGTDMYLADWAIEPLATVLTEIVGADSVRFALRRDGSKFEKLEVEAMFEDGRIVNRVIFESHRRAVPDTPPTVYHCPCGYPGDESCNGCPDGCKRRPAGVTGWDHIDGRRL